ncbi:MAG: Hsp20/alpha crystallin family protein [Planctomycetes bacterium]|nr:Hsp20/alpha crystallin family protein [Planctomycetota bacterium]
MFNLIPWRKKENSGRVTTRETSRPLASLRNEFDRLFDRFLSRWPAPVETTWSQGNWNWGRFWGFDVEDREREVVVRAEAPGFEAESFDVQISGNLLTIQAEKRHESKGRHGNGHHAERRYETFRRVTRLPAGILADKIEAKYHNGVLEIHVPKSQAARSQRVPVKG